MESLEPRIVLTSSIALDDHGFGPLGQEIHADYSIVFPSSTVKAAASKSYASALQPSYEATPAFDTVGEIESNNTPASAQALTIPVGDILSTPAGNWLTVTGSITAGDADFYQITLSQRSGIFLDIDARDIGLSGNLDSILTVYNSAQTPLATSDEGYDFEGFDTPLASTFVGGISNDASLYADLAAGTYYVRVTPFTGTGAYQLRLLADTNYASTVPAFDSLPGAADTLYLDFDGHAATNAWGSYSAAAYDFSGNGAEFSPGERLAYRNTWRAIAEDFSPFNINVSTVSPASFNDGQGYRMVITSSSPAIVGQPTGILGVAYLQSYASFGASDNVGFTWANNFNTFEYSGEGGNSGRIMASALEIANTSSHEFGHALGLHHYATSSGSAGPATVVPTAIMATPDTGFNREHWGQGIAESGAIQDDDAIISGATNTFGYRADDHGNSTAAATILSGTSITASGIIENIDANDSDFFRFSGNGNTTITVDIDGYTANLDPILELYDANGVLLQAINPANPVDATIIRTLAAGVHFARVRSDGQFGEMGQYTLRIDTQPNAPAGTTVAVTDGNAVVTDLNSMADQLIISRNADQLRVHDPINKLVAGAGATQVTPNTVEIPFASITGQLIVNTGDGADTVTLDFGGGDPIPTGGLNYAGGPPNGAPGDKLILQNGTFATANYTFENANDGSMLLDPDGFGGTAGSLITYTGLDPISSSITVTDITLNYSAEAETITVRQFAADTTRTEVVSTAAESLDFTAPINSLTINMGNTGNDTVNVNGFGTGYKATFKIDDQDQTGADVVNLNTQISLGSTTSSGHIDVRASTINVFHDLRTDSEPTNAAGVVLLHGTTVLRSNSILIDATGPLGSGNVTFFGDVVADDNTGANNRALTINAGNAGVQFLGRVGTTATNGLADLDATGGFIFLQGNVTVDDLGGNTLTFNGQVSLAADVTIDVDGAADNDIVFNGRISQPPSTPRRDLTIVAGGANLTFNGIVGDPSTTLDLLTVTSAGVVDFNQAVVANNIAISATKTNLTSTITALTDDVTITGNVVLEGNVTIVTGSGTGDDFTVTGTLIADNSSTQNRTLTVNAVSGTARFQSTVGSAIGASNTSLADLDVTAGLIRMGGWVVVDDMGAGVNTATFNGPIQLETNGIVIDSAAAGSGNNIVFAGTINADDAAANNRDLIVVSNTGTIHLQGAVGNLQPLASFQLAALNGAVRLAANVTATDGLTGNVDFTAPLIQLETNLVINTDGASADKQVTFQGAVNADNAATQDRTLTIHAGTAGVGMFGTLGNLQPLADLDVTAGLFATNGNLVVNDGPAAAITFSGDLGFDVTDTATINTNGTNDHGLVVGGRLFGNAAVRNMAVVIDAGTATVQFGSIGTGTIPGDVTSAALADLDITAGLIRLLGNVVIDDQGGNTASFNGPVELAADVSFDLDVASGTDNSVLFGGTISSDGTERDLTFAAGGGNLTFAAALGAAPGELDLFTVSSAGLAEFDSTVRANHVAMTATTVRLQNNVTALTDGVTITGATVLDGNVVISTGGGAGGDVSILGTVNADLVANNRTLTIAAGSGNAAFGGAIGNTQALQSLTATSADVTAGAITLVASGALTITNTGTASAISGAITGNGATLSKGGAGLLVLSGVSTYTGPTTVTDGRLNVNGSITSNVVVTSPGVLGGAGIITGNVSGTGTVAPGASPGVLTIIGTFAPGGLVDLEAASPYTTSGTHFDQIVVTGAVDLSAATLSFVGAGGPAASGQVITFIGNDSADATIASASPTNGTIVLLGGQHFVLEYNGGDGNDVTLTAFTPNSPPTVSLTNMVTALAEDTSTASPINVADVNVSDDGVGSNNVTLTGADAAMFEVVNGKLRLKAGTTLDYEVNPVLNVTVNVDDPDIGTSPDDSKALVINLTDVNEAPAVALANTTTSLAENTSTASAITVANIVVSDDALGDETLSLTGADANFFEIVGSELRLKASTTLDFEAKSSYAVTVNVDDPALGTSVESSVNYTLSVTDANEAPSVALDNIVSVLSETTGTSSAITVANIVVTDDALGNETLSLSGEDAAVFEIVGGELRLKAGTTLNFEQKSSYAVTVNVDDQEFGTGVESSVNYTLSVTDANEAPTVALTNLTTSLAENTSTASAITVANIVVSDDALGDETLSLSGPDAAFFEIVGSELRLKAGTTLNFEAKSSYAVTVNVDDAALGTGVASSVNYTLSVTDANEAPTVALTNLTTSLAENTSTASAITVANIVVTDDALGDETLSLSGPDAAFFEIVGGELRLKAGTTLDFEAKSSYAVTVDVDDPTLGTGIDSSVDYTLSVTDVNEAPTVALTGTTASLAENTSTASAITVANIVVTDDALGDETLSLTGADAAFFEIVGSELRLKAGTTLDFEAKSSYAVTVHVDDPALGTGVESSVNYTLSVTDVNEAPSVTLNNIVSVLSETTDTSNAIKVADIQVTDDALGNEALSLSGADASFFEIVGSELRLKAGTTLDFETNPVLDVVVSVDDTSVGDTPDDIAVLAIAVTNTNDAPRVTLTNTVTVLAEDTSTASPINVADVNVSDDGVGSNNVTLTGADAAMFEVVNGKLRLKAGTTLDYEVNAVLNVTVNVDDPDIGTSPDDSKALVINLTDVNEAPAVALTNTTTSLAENTSTASAIKVANIVVTDDALGDETLSLTGADAAFFEIVAGELRLKASTTLNFEQKSSYAVTVNVDDAALGTGVESSVNYTLSVTDANEAPTVALTYTTASLAENTSTASAIRVANIVVSDDALGDERLSLSGPDAAFFEIVGSELRLKAGTTLDFEANPVLDVVVSVDDTSVGATPDNSVVLAIAITNTNDAPSVTITNMVTSLAENTSTASPINVADVTVSDDGVGTNNVTLTGADAAMFEVVNGKLRLKADQTLDYEAKSSYTVTVNVDDPVLGSGVDSSVNYTLTITDVNEVPTVSLANTINALGENTSTASTIKVADIQVTDDALGNETLSLSGADAPFFEIVGSELRLKAGTSLDFEQKSSYAVTVNVDDSTLGGGIDSSVNYTLTVTDVNEAPTVSLANTINALGENTSTASAIKVADIQVTDDALRNETLSLSGLDAAFFEIVGNELRLKAGTALDFEAKSSYAVTVNVDDAALGTGVESSVNYTLSVADANEAPTVALTNTTTSLAENTSTASAITVANIVVTDDALGDETLSLSGPDASFFEIVANALRLKAGTTLNFEQKSSYAVTVNVDDPTLGTGIDSSVDYTLTLTDVNETPTVSLANTINALGENTSTASAIKVANVVVTDDALGDETLSLSGADAALFEIIGGELFLKAGTILDFDSNPVLDVTVSVDDATVGVTPDDSKSLTITITTANSAPTGSDKRIAINEDTTYTFSVSDFGFADPFDSPPNRFNAVRLSTLPNSGTLRLSGAAVSVGQFIAVTSIQNGQLQFTPALNATGLGRSSFTFQVQDDGGTSGTGANLDPTPNTLTFDIAGINDAPRLNTSGNPQIAPVNEDAANPPGTLIEVLLAGAVTDSDTDALRGIAVTQVSNGTWQYSLNAGGSWSDIGAVSNATARLLPANGQTLIRFKPNANFHGSAKIFYRAWDQTTGNPGGTADLSLPNTTGDSTAYSEAVDFALATVRPLNDAPKLDTTLSPTLSAIDENNRNSWGTPVWTLLQGYSDNDAGATKGLAITAAAGAANGVWQYTLDGGETWQALGAVSLSSARLLPANGNLSRVRFVPNINFHGTVQLGYFAWDQTQGITGGMFDLSGSGEFGGTTAFGWGYETASLTINPVNDAPLLTLPSAPLGYSRNSPAVLLASTATVKDPDNTNFAGGWLKVQIMSGADAKDRLSIGGAFKVVNGNLIWNNQATIGTVQGGVSSSALIVQLNANATLYRVEQLVRSIKFGTLGSSKTGQRTVAFSVSDGLSTSNVATLDVQVS